MIKANDLRLDNWVYIKNTRGLTPIKVLSINAEGIQLSSDDIYDPKPDIYNEAIIPIPLTDELLEKCGFILNKEVWRWHRDGITICDDINNIHYFWDLSEDGGYTLLSDWMDLKYLHQLQNLFYSLTGTELEINLSEKV